MLIETRLIGFVLLNFKIYLKAVVEEINVILFC